MNELKITTNIRVCCYDELSSDEKNLIDSAKSASFNAYAPYSEFLVGAAALLENGEIICGNNQENAAYPSGLCAERVTLFAANSMHPQHAIVALALAAQNGDLFTKRVITPCGGCRQVILETEKRFDKPIRILMYGEDRIYIAPSAASLLPLSFGEPALNNR